MVVPREAAPDSGALPPMVPSTCQLEEEGWILSQGRAETGARRGGRCALGHCVQRLSGSSSGTTLRSHPGPLCSCSPSSLPLGSPPRAPAASGINAFSLPPPSSCLPDGRALLPTLMGSPVPRRVLLRPPPALHSSSLSPTAPIPCACLSSLSLQEENPECWATLPVPPTSTAGPDVH